VAALGRGMAAASAARQGAGRDRVPRAASARAMRLGLLVASGGDERLALDPASRRNRYGVPARPAPDELWFSSSTACAVSPRGWAAAGELLERLSAGAVEIGDRLDEVRARLVQLYGAPGAEAILCASGTEAELAALALALALAEGPLVNILAAPAETGSGASAAAAGRHFLGGSSLGGPVARGARLAGWEDAPITLEAVEIRRPDGRLRAAAEVDRQAALQTGRAVAAGAFVLLHVLDASKTGQPGIGRAAARQIAARHPGRVLVLVDACQLRAPAEALRADVAAGFAVMLTGSKFAGGPPFSGALLAPQGLVERLAGGPTAGAALAPYSAALDWPASLRPRFAAGLTHPANLGLALRWAAALAEIEAFEALAASRRQILLEAFRAAVHARIAELSGLALLDGPRSAGAAGLVAIVDRDGADANAVHAALMAPSDRLARPCHLGQPVAVAGRVALRVCASMPMITAAAETGFSALEADLDALFEAWAAARRKP